MLAVTWGVAAMGVWCPSFVWVDRVVGRPSLWVTGGLVVAAWVVARSARGVAPRTAAVVTAVLAMLALVAAAFFSFISRPLGVSAPAPRADGVVEVVVVETAAVIDPVWTVEVRQPGWGLTARRWVAACLNGDDPADSFAGASWDGTTLVVHVDDGRRLVVPTHPVTGRPGAYATTGATYACP